MTDAADLAGLFAAALLAATLLPGGSEVYFGWLDRSSLHPDWLLIVVASAGNTLGSMTSWLIGRLVPPRKGLEERHPRAFARVRRYGASVLVFTWVPVLGDPLALAAGWLRVPFWPALAFTALGKTARYAALALLF